MNWCARLLAAAVTILAAALPARAQVQVLIPFPAGGGTDIIGRLIQPVFSQELGQQIVIRNVGGAGGTLGTAEIARARPDGTNLLLTSMAPIAIQPSFRPSLPYRAESLAPICLVADSPLVMMTPQNTGIRTIADMVARAKAEPGRLPFATGGVGGISHLAMLSLTRAAGVEMNHVPFRGSGDAMLAMQQGTVPLMSAEANLVQQYGLHAVGVYARERMPEFPNTPTMKEQGYDVAFQIWTGLFAPAGTPDPVLARIEAACARTLRSPSVVDGMTRAAHPIRYLDRAEFAAFIQGEVRKYAAIIEETNLRQAE
jgi:tripartite-type tricarboxylate transporter receptor subunit TctC